MATQKELKEIGELLITHHLEEANQLLREGWYLVSAPCSMLRRVNFNRDGHDYQPIDIEWKQFVLARKRREDI